MNPNEFPEPHSESSPVFRFGEFELDLSDETLWRGSDKLNVNRRMFQVLRLLIERRGEIVTKEEFFEKVWGGSFVEDNNLTVTITALRKILGDNAKQAGFIENLPRKGYRFVAPVSVIEKTPVVDQLPPVEGKASETIPLREPDTGKISHHRSARPAFWVLAAFVIVILAFAVVGFNGFWPLNFPAAKRVDSVAVLPFVNRTEGSEYLADGLTDSIINNLSRFSGLRVIDRNSAYQYKNTGTDPAAAGRELNVRTVLTGQVERQGDVLIINAELIDLKNNVTLWRQPFRRQASELFAIQQEISQAVVKNLFPEPTATEQSQLSKSQTNDPVAYDLYLKGRYYWNKRTGPDMLRSAELFKQAIDKDPTFAKAYVGLADAYTLTTPPNTSYEEKNSMIRGAIKKALEIDPNLGEAYAAQAINKCYYDWDLKGAEIDYLRALELNPNDATAHHWYAEFLSMQGRFDESFAEYDKAISLDPLSLPIRADKAFGYYYARDYDKALELLNKEKELNPDYKSPPEFLMFVYREKGMLDEAIDSEEKRHAISFQLGEATSSAHENRKIHMAHLRSGLKEKGSDGYWKAEMEYGITAPYYKAVAYAKLGDADNAFAYLEQAFKERYSGMVWLKVTPELDNLRSDPRYHDLLQRVGLAP